MAPLSLDLTLGLLDFGGVAGAAEASRSSVASLEKNSSERSLIMNGTMAPEDRLNRKRALESELEAIRIQKAEVLRAIQQIAKKQKLGGPPSKHAGQTHDAKVEAERRFHTEHIRRIWGMCSRVVSEVIKQPRDLGTIKSESRIHTNPTACLYF